MTTFSPSDQPSLAPRLPIIHNPLLGRDADVTAVLALMSRADVALLTLTGPGGVGKTRLAIEVARLLADEFTDGVLFVELASLSDARLVLHMLAQALDIEEMVGSALIPRLASALQARPRLLVLDNFEQVLDAAAEVGELLSACPKLKVLVTSRSALRLSAEQEYPVAPLSIPDTRHLPAPSELEQTAAVALFCQRARAIQPNFALTTANAAAVAEICRRLDGLPLAIELAAARVKVLAPPALLERLDSQLALLTGGARDLPARQRTMRNAITWSYDLLTSDEQRLLRQLAIFVGGWTITAAEVVCDSDLSVFDGLASLTDHSLIRPAEQLGGDARFTMLETIRSFGLEQLQSTGEWARLEARHAACFTKLAEEAADQFDGHLHEQAMATLEADIDNLRAAWTWIERHTDEASTLGAQLLHAQWRVWLFWREQGRSHEGERRIQSLLAALAAPPAARAAALNALGALAIERDDSDAAWTYYAEALTIARAEVDRPSEIQALYGLARAVGWGSNAASSIPHFEEALAVARAANDLWHLSGILLDLGSTWADLGEHTRAKHMLLEALQINRDLGNAGGTTVALLNLADIALRHDHDVQAASSYTRQALELTQTRSGRRRSRISGSALHMQATIALASGFPARAVRLFGAVEMIFETIAIPIPTFFMSYHQQQLAETRRLLDGAVWQRAWQEGRAMSIEQAFAYALEPPEPEGDAPPSGVGLLSRRELDVLRLIADGKSNQEIAEALFISPHTVATHTQNILNKLGVDSRTAAATWAVRNGLA